MSRSSSHAAQAQPPSPPSLPDLAALAERLQETAQALLAFCGNGSAKPVPPAPEERAAPGALRAGRNAPLPEEPDEIRCYRFSPLALSQERALLEEQDTEDFRGLLYRAFSSLSAFTALMENIEAEAELEGSVIHILARELKRTEYLLFRIQDAYSTVEPVEAEA